MAKLNTETSLTDYIKANYGDYKNAGSPNKRKSISDVSQALKNLGIDEKIYKGSAKQNMAILKELKRMKSSNMKSSDMKSSDDSDFESAKNTAKETVGNLPKAIYSRKEDKELEDSVNENKISPKIKTPEEAWSAYQGMKKKKTQSGSDSSGTYNEQDDGKTIKQSELSKAKMDRNAPSKIDEVKPLDKSLYKEPNKPIGSGMDRKKRTKDLYAKMEEKNKNVNSLFA